MRRSRISIALLPALAVLASAGTAHADPAVPSARVDDARPLGASALRALLERQRADGLFDDQTGRTVGREGLPTVAFAALHQLASLDEDDDADATAWRSRLARRTLARGSGASVILRWPLAMAVGEGLDAEMPDGGADLRNRVRTWNRLRAAGIADRCYRDPRCFNNYKLADAVLDLELARSGLRSNVRGARLRDPAALRRRALRFLATLPRVARATGRVVVPGRARVPAAILSDPEMRPLAYHALCTAWAVRASVLAGRAAPSGLRTATRRALWGLVGIAGPDGEVSWSGRGQDQAWTLAAALYAASAGSRVLSRSDPVLAARLRRLADLELQALRGRLRGGALAVLPSGNDDLVGLDHYYSATGSTGLALTWLELAVDALPDPDARRLDLPSQVAGGGFADPATTGLVTRRVGATWLAVRMRRDHAFEPRQDFGLMRALRLRGDGTWRELRPSRPGPISRRGRSAVRVPLGGPALVLRGQRWAPRATGWRPTETGVELTGAWRSPTGRRLPARWRFGADARGAKLGLPCVGGSRFELTEWLPRRGALRRDGGRLERAGFWMRVAPRPRVRVLGASYVNARQPRLRALRLAVTCTGAPISVRWDGSATAAP